MTVPWLERDPDALRALEATLRARYPTLHAFTEDGVCRIRGAIEIVPGDRYGIELELPSNYPHALPIAWETEGRIPREIDRHTFPNGSLCLGPPLALWLALDGDFSIERVIDVPVRNFLVGNSLVEEGQPWPYDDYAHGAAGIIQHLSEVLGTTDAMMLCKLLVDLMQGRVRGHWTCPCGSGLIIRKCHRDAIERLRRVPHGILAHAVDTMLDHLKRQRKLAQAAPSQ